MLPGHFRRCPVVREGGVEPPRPCGHWNLNPARLPIPPPAHLGVAASGLHLFGATAWRHLKISTPRRVGSHPFVSGARQANKEVGRGPAPAGADTPDRGRPRPERCGEDVRQQERGARETAPTRARPRCRTRTRSLPCLMAALPVPQSVDGARASTTGPAHGVSEWTAGATHRTWRTAPHRPRPARVAAADRGRTRQPQPAVTCGVAPGPPLPRLHHPVPGDALPRDIGRPTDEARSGRPAPRPGTPRSLHRRAARFCLTPAPEHRAPPPRRRPPASAGSEPTTVGSPEPTVTARHPQATAGPAAPPPGAAAGPRPRPAPEPQGPNPGALAPHTPAPCRVRDTVHRAPLRSVWEM